MRFCIAVLQGIPLPEQAKNAIVEKYKVINPLLIKKDLGSLLFN